MRRRLGAGLMALGVALVIAALVIVVSNQIEASNAAKASDDVLSRLTSEVESTPGGWMDPNREMTVVEIDGDEYIGYLSIPSIDLELPVMANWSYAGLRTAPGRYAGNVFDDSMVVLGHSYARHFAKLYSVEDGDEVTFSDMDGNVFHYVVSYVDTLNPSQVGAMVAKSADYDLTLFTCTLSGSARWTVRCVRTGVDWAR